MIIHEPKIEVEGAEVSVSARIEFQQTAQEMPERLWFKFPAKYVDWISSGSESFAAAILLTAMYWGEDMEIRGTVSPKFANGIEEYKHIFHLWEPQLFRDININYASVEEPKIKPRPARVLTAFSGGLDSMFTLWENLPKNQKLKQFQISHGFFMQGIDYSLDEDEAYQSTLNKYTELFKSLDLDLISARTNATLFSKYRINHAWIYGGILIGTGLALSAGFPKLYIPAGHPYTFLDPAGSLPLVDYLLSTEIMEVIHHGAVYGRSEKLQQIAEWSVAQNNLRVCTRSPKRMDGINCSACGKCRQTMIRLEMMGKLSNYSTFTHPITLATLIPWALDNQFLSITVREMTKMAVKENRWGFVLGLGFVRVGGIVRRWVKRIVPLILGRERTYRLKRWYYGRDAEAR